MFSTFDEGYHYERYACINIDSHNSNDTPSSSKLETLLIRVQIQKSIPSLAQNEHNYLIITLLQIDNHFIHRVWIGYIGWQVCRENIRSKLTQDSVLDEYTIHFLMWTFTRTKTNFVFIHQTFDSTLHSINKRTQPIIRILTVIKIIFYILRLCRIQILYSLQ